MKKIYKEKKEKMQKTLDRMQKVREDNSRYLRDLIDAKLKWAKAEREKGIKAIEVSKNNINKISQQVLKLNGAITVLTELLEPKKEFKN